MMLPNGNERGEKMKILKSKLFVIMATSGITQGDIAKKMGVSRSYISTVLARGTCSPKTAGRIAKALNVSVESIVEVPNDQ